MQYTKYLLAGLGALALISVIVAASYAVLYFNEKKTGIRIQNDIAAEKASLVKPKISLEGISCEIPEGAKTQYYSVVIRTPDSNINNKQKQTEDAIRALGGTITSTSQTRIQDTDAGYSNSANISASLPISQTGALISQIKDYAVKPDYLEGENNYVQDRATIKQICQGHLDYLKNLSSTELLYLSQLNFDQPEGMPVPTVSVNSGLTAKNLTEVRQNASGYKSSIENVMNQINKTSVNITVKIIPG